MFGEWIMCQDRVLMEFFLKHATNIIVIHKYLSNSLFNLPGYLKKYAVNVISNAPHYPMKISIPPHKTSFVTSDENGEVLK